MSSKELHTVFWYCMHIVHTVHNTHAVNWRNSTSSIVACYSLVGGYFVPDNIVLDPILPHSHCRKQHLFKHNNSTALNSQTKICKNTTYGSSHSTWTLMENSGLRKWGLCHSRPLMTHMRQSLIGQEKNILPAEVYSQNLVRVYANPLFHRCIKKKNTTALIQK